MPEFSIIIPVYKVEKYLCQCVDSVLEQNYSDFEIILVDDGSPDNCPKICDEYTKKDSRISVVHKTNGGLSSARNAGLPLAHGRYVWFVDSDDYLPENALVSLEKYFSENADIIHFGFACDQFNGEITKSKPVYIGTTNKNKMAELVETACSSHLFTYVWRSIYKNEFLKKHNLKFKDGLSFAEDSAFNSAAFLLADKMIFADECAYVYRDRSDGISKTINASFDGKIIEHFSEYDKIRDESYEKFSIAKDEKYYKDAGKFTLNNIFYSSIVQRIYRSSSKRKFHFFKKLCKTEMIKKAFKRFDINAMKSNSLDWWMFWAVKHRLYFAGHLICKYILFK